MYDSYCSDTMVIEENVDLMVYNTLGFAVTARFFCTINYPHDLTIARQFCHDNALPWLILGDGSNIILTEDFVGLVIFVCISGKEVVEPSLQSKNHLTNHDDNSVLLKVGAGENWDDLVAYTLNQGWYGLENLSLIPGKVGAAPIQNIGAYGVELVDRLYEVGVFDLHTGSSFTLSKAACELNYRDSIFKSHPHWLITHVILKLSILYKINIAYTGLVDQIQSQFDKAAALATPLEVRQAVVAIRQKKLPDPKVIPNVGSFFKNPTITPAHAKKLQHIYPDLVCYDVETAQGHAMVKLAAGWLIDKLRWKGFVNDGVGVHAQQALVLVKCGEATGADLLALAKRIQTDVQLHFDIALEIEPRVFGSNKELG